MAHGRRDYTWGVLQDSILPGRYSVNWFEAGTADVGTGDFATIIHYLVPSGYRFFLTGVFVTASLPHMNNLLIAKNEITLITKFFNLNYDVNLGSIGSYMFDPGDYLNILVFNNDELDVSFFVQAFGVIELLV